jgi:alkylation response protein AidB-like acyl-CoA dehydrogenase
LRTSARVDGDEWVINGTKTWNTGAHTHTHEWLAVRTGGAGRRGISIIVVPLDAEGVQITPIWTWGDQRTNEVHFDAVRVPRGHLIGEVNMGWTYITAALDLERATLGSVGGLRRLVDGIRDATEDMFVDGRSLCEDEPVRLQLAELHARVQIAQLLSYAAASSKDADVAGIQATALKLMTSELLTRIASVGMSLLGRRGQLAAGDPEAPLQGLLERAYRLAPVYRFGGGTNEVLRDIVARRACGMPTNSRR